MSNVHQAWDYVSFIIDHIVPLKGGSADSHSNVMPD